MTRYEMELDIPLGNDPEDLTRFVEALRAFGYPRIIFRVETSDDMPQKHELARNVANEFSGLLRHDRLECEQWWYERLKPVRGMHNIERWDAIWNDA